MSSNHTITIRTLALNGKRFTIDTSDSRPAADIADDVAGAYWEAFEGSGLDDNEIMERAEAMTEALI